jgi:hypothetical protein
LNQQEAQSGCGLMMNLLLSAHPQPMKNMNSLKKLLMSCFFVYEAEVAVVVVVILYSM